MSLGPTSTAYCDELRAEISTLDAEAQKHATRLVTDELKRVEQGSAKKQVPLVEAHHDRPQGIAVKVKVPLQEFPKFNFVGKLLGPKGMSLKRLQEETGTKMSILGKGSMRDKNKEEEMKKEGGKYAHLNEDLHVLIEVYSEVSDAYARLSHALAELKKYMSPEYNDEIHQQQMQMQEMMYMSNGDKPAGPPGPPGPPMAGRGGPRGRGGILGGIPSRGAPSGRGAPPPRGAPRGAPPGRGAPAGRGRPAPPPPAPAPTESAYEEYGAGYDEYADPYARESYDSSYGGGAGDTQYFDYGHGSGAQPAYEESYGSAAKRLPPRPAPPRQPTGDSSWQGNTLKAPAAPAARGRGQYRAHPYSGGRGGY